MSTPPSLPTHLPTYQPTLPYLPITRTPTYLYIFTSLPIHLHFPFFLPTNTFPPLPRLAFNSFPPSPAIYISLLAFQYLPTPLIFTLPPSFSLSLSIYISLPTYRNPIPPPLPIYTVYSSYLHRLFSSPSLLCIFTSLSLYSPPFHRPS